MSGERSQCRCAATFANETTSPSDPDVDSQMRSSSSDEADSEAMFPTELDPPGSITQHHPNAIVSESSGVTPPQSQDQGEAMDTGAAQGNLSGQIEGGNWGDESRGPTAWVPQSDFAKSAAEAQHEPGSGWTNRKAREEYQRAAMMIEDRNFSLQEFGDPFDETLQDEGREKN